MKVQYRVSAKAIQDIDEVWLYTLENWSVDQANRYYNLIYEEIEYIVKDFEGGKSMDEIKQGYRQTKMKSHLIFYKLADDGIIEIVRVLHQMMDIPNKF